MELNLGDPSSAAESVFTFHTERRPAGAERWRSARQLVVHLDRGEHALPGQLAWRGRDGAEAAIGFHPTMRSFYGHHRTADGTLAEYRGTLERRSLLPGADAHTHEPLPNRFRTEESRGRSSSWHASGGLSLLVDDGGAPVERVTWRDQTGNAGSAVLQADTSEAGGAREVTTLIRQVQASGEHRAAGEIAWNLVERSRDKWLADFPGRAWLEFTLRRPVVVRHYVLTSANDAQDRDPRTWTLSGSNDARNWTTFDSRTGEFFPTRHRARGFSTGVGDGATGYSHYRLEITGNAGSPQVQLAAIQLFEAVTAPAVTGFLGYYQRADTEPTGYRGTSLSSPEQPTGPTTAGTPATGTMPPGTADVPGKPMGARTGAATPARAAIQAVPPITAAPVAAHRLCTVEQWRPYLATYSAHLLRTIDRDELRGVSEEQRAAGWLGFHGASEQQIAALEVRLGTRLPPSYRSFLAASDGWRHLGPFMEQIRTTETVGWCEEVDSLLWDMITDYDEEEPDGPQKMERGLLVSLEGDAQFWLLDPGDASEDGEWAAYTWSSWYPGWGERHESFAALVADERASFENLKDHDGKGPHPEEPRD
ncbi:SMI1/KNR4 family protein [Streptomyces sp. NPDC056656]|uniref:SMI1/KNR4 family protein n=1 Tax=Streptomyces sp. NPDC056656 TaxID=3345895 RepID=UPI0036AB98E6